MPRNEGQNDRDVLFRLGVAKHPDSKKTVEDLQKQVKSLDRATAQSAQESANMRIKAAKQAAQEQINAFRQSKQAHEDFARKSRELNERFVSESEGAAQAVLQLGRGIATLGLTGEQSTEKILRGLVAIQGGFDTAFGSLKIFTQGLKSLSTFNELLGHRRGGGLGGGGGGGGGGFLGDLLAEGGGEAIGEGLRHGAPPLWKRVRRLGSSRGRRAFMGRAARFGAPLALGAGKFGLAAGVAGGKLGLMAGVGLAGAAVGDLAGRSMFGGDIEDSMAVKGLAKLSEVTGITAQNLTTFGGLLTFQNSRIAKSADDLVTARKKVIELEGLAEKRAKEKEREAIRAAHRARVDDARVQRVVGGFDAANDAAAAREGLVAAQAGPGQQRAVANRLAQQRFMSQFKFFEKMKNQGGAKGEAAKLLLGEARNNLISLGQEQLDMTQQRMAQRATDFARFKETGRREQERLAEQIERGQKALPDLLPTKRKELAAEISKAQGQIKKIDMAIDRNTEVKLQLDKADEDLARRLANDVARLLDQREAKIQQEFAAEFSKREQESMALRNNQIHNLNQNVAPE